MKDTAFFVPDEKKERFAQIYNVVEPGVFAIAKDRHLGMEGFGSRPAFESGGAGLVSTVEDYGKFAMMLANGGTYDGVRILSPYTVEFMGSSQDGFDMGDIKRLWLWISLPCNGHTA